MSVFGDTGRGDKILNLTSPKNLSLPILVIDWIRLSLFAILSNVWETLPVTSRKSTMCRYLKSLSCPSVWQDPPEWRSDNRVYRRYYDRRYDWGNNDGLDRVFLVSVRGEEGDGDGGCVCVKTLHVGRARDTDGVWRVWVKGAKRVRGGLGTGVGLGPSFSENLYRKNRKSGSTVSFDDFS